MRGDRSADAAKLLEAMGYTNISDYSGGWIDWTGWGDDLDSKA